VLLVFAALARRHALVDALLVLGVAFVSVLLARQLIAPEEGADLETALGRMRTDLEGKTQALSQERQELATLMGALSDAILAIDAGGNPLFFNSRFALLFGGSDFGQRRPRLGEVFRVPELLETFQQALTAGSRGECSVPLHVRSEGLLRHFVVSVAPLSSYGAVGIFHDVTELKRAEKVRIDFVANVSHELRTPLTAIKGYADTLKADIAEGRHQSAGKFIDVITRNVERLMDLVRDLLELSSLESAEAGGAGARPFVKTEIRTRELTERVLAQLDGRRGDKNHSIEVEYGASTFAADGKQAEQVLVNLLENAIKYVPRDGRIQVRWEKRPEGTFLHVADTGPGIPPEHQPRLFERFYRVDQSRGRDSGGTGLGLAIVKHIMGLHGGAAWVISEPGRGAEFVCRFPE
jgi:two-component system phosphate regulon sensor histidine kinase PhoR